MYKLQDLFWEATLRCNARCAFCGSRCGPEGGEELTTEQITAAFEDVAAHMDARQVMIHVTGGEPLLRQDLCEVMARCAGLGFPWGMVTNGMLLTKQTVQRLQAAGMKTASVSLDGLEATHEALRGVKGSFQKVLQGIRVLKEAAFLQQLQVTTVVSRKNIHELEQLYRLLRELGVDSWRLAMVDSIGRASDRGDLSLGRQELERYLGFIAAHRDDPVLPVTTSCSHYFGDFGELGRPAFLCRAGKSIGSILSNGDVYVCPNVPRRAELVQGNVKTDSFSRLWQEGFGYFRSPQVRSCESCRDCPDQSLCRGDSMHTWNFEENRPGFCYRELFPRPRAMPPLLSRLPLHGLKAIHLRYGAHPKPLVFTPNAARELSSFFRWGQRHPVNLSEQMACLIGHELADCDLVEFVCPVYLENRRATEATFVPESLQSACRELDAVNEAYEQTDFRLVDGPCVLLGLAHSHPDGLPLQLSLPDVQLHRSLGLKYSLLLNPQTRRIAAWTGEQLALCDLTLLTQPEEAPGWDIQTL